MKKATWDEIKLLASDFKRAQEVSSLNKLSERNCIDIINFLIDNDTLKVYFTTDGKTVLTPEELVKEIYEELEVQNNRIHLGNLASALDLDSHIIDTCVNKMIQNDNSLQLVNNNLFNSSYVRMVALQINNIVKEKNSVNILELTQKFDLPKPFIEKLIVNNSFGVIQAIKEGDLVFTESFIRRFSALIRGYLTRSSTAIYLYSFVDKNSISERLIRKIVNDAIKEGRLDGTFDQNKNIYTPNNYINNQRLFVHRYFEQNGYIEYSTMADIGITNPSKYIEMEFPNSIQLSSCAVGEVCLAHIEEALNETLIGKGALDCLQVVQFPINFKDLSKLVSKLVKNDLSLLLECGYFIHKQFLTVCLNYLDDFIKKKAEEYAKTNRKTLVTILSESSFKDNDEEYEGGKGGNAKMKNPMKQKSGGGQRGRELKNKAVKNKYMVDKKTKKGLNTDTNDLDECLTEEEFVNLLSPKFQNENFPEDFYSEIYSLLKQQIESKFKSECQSVILQTSDTAKNKEEHQKIESSVIRLFGKMKVFEKSINEISDVELQKSLTNFTIKSIGSDVADCIFVCVAKMNGLDYDSASATLESKAKLVAQIKGNVGTHVKNLNKVIKDADSFANFYSSLQEVCGLLDIYPKNLDKKSEKRLMLEIVAEYHSIIQNKFDSKQEIDPAELLLVTTLLLYYKLLGTPIHASGKFVPQLIPYLESKQVVENFQWSSLKEYQEYVILNMKMKSSKTEEEILSIKSNYAELHNTILNMALNWKNIK